MAEAILDLRLDTVQPNRVRLVYGVQNDYNSRYICARFTVNGKPIDIEKTAAVRINAKRPDGNKDAFPGTVNTDGTAKVPVAQWMLDVPGEVSASITAVTTSGALTTQEFYIMAKASIWDSTGEPSAENPDKDVLQTIIASENERVAAESTRVANENARKSAETARATAETKRITDEATRVANEAGRVSAEEIRREEFATWQDEWGKISSFDKRIENLEAAVSPEIVKPVVDDTVAYQKTVPKGALPNAAITEIGGMSYVKNGVLVDSKVEAVESVGANLLPYTPRTVTHNGITYTVNADGSVTANGTAKGQSFFFVRNNSLLSKGTYTLSGCPSGGTGSTYCLYAVLDNTDYSTIKGDMGNGSSFTLNEDRYLAIHINISNGFTARNLTFKPMFNRGSTALPYSLYFRESLAIPADALDGFGQGVNAQYCNKIVLDPLEGVKKYVRAFNKIKLNGISWRGENSLFYGEPIGKGAIKRTASITEIPNMVIEKYTPTGAYYVVGAGTKTDKTICVYEGYLYVYDKSYSTVDAFLAASGDVELIYELATPTETDVSHLFTDDNLLPVEAGGTITAANEFEHEVPFTVEYMIKGA